MKLKLLATLAFVPAVFGQTAGAPLKGMWDATATLGELTVPFHMEISSQGTTARASFFNGEDRFPSTAGHYENGKLHLEFNYYTATLDAEWKDGELVGTYDRPERGAQRSYVVHARPHVDLPQVSGAPNIDGTWELAVKCGKGEAAWYFLVHQKGSHIDTAILRGAPLFSASMMCLSSLLSECPNTTVFS